MISEYIYGGAAVEEIRERQPHRTRWLWLLLEGLLLLVALPIGAYCLLYGEVRPVTVWELTGSCPPASVLLRDGSEGRWCFDTGKIDWRKTGDALVLVAGSAGPRIALLRQVDTTAPEARGLSPVLGVDEEPGPETFIADLRDAQLVGISFEEPPRFHEAGTWPVVVRLEDLSGNVSFVETSCTILGAVPRVDMEAGEAVPPLSAFLPNDTVDGRFVTDMAALDTRTPGVRTVEVEAEGQVYETALVIADTRAPRCAFETAAYARTGQALAPEDLVAWAQDASALTYAFDPQPDWTRQGYQNVQVVVTDAGGNRTTGTVPVLISDLQPLVWEASRRWVAGATVRDRQRELDPAFSGEVKVARFVPKAPGCYDINATVDEVPCIQRLYVVDTTAPRLSFPRKLQAYLDHPRPPAALLETAEDATALTLSYVTEPDWSKEGPQPVIIAGVDVAGNRTEAEGTVTIVRDTEKPLILGAVNQYSYIGEPVAYFAHVSATDNADDPEDIVITVDNSAVDIYTQGSYLVTYRATDRAGNTAEKQVYLYFIRPSVSDEKLNQKADEVLATLVTDDMTKGQKAYAIYRYVYDTYTFKNNSSNKRDWKYEAWRGLAYRRGDCFTYCAAAKILLEKIGAKAMFVTRNHAFRHYWLMVDVGTGWYHFDPLNSGPSRKFQCFMLTTGQVLDLYPFFWKYDQRIYPATPETPFVKDW